MSSIRSILLFVRLPAAIEDRLNIAIVIVDVLVIAILVYITGELDSPFFVFYSFVLIAAAIRWEWTGTIATALALQAILILVGVPDVEDGESELNFLILRSVFCWVTVLMLGYFGSYRSRSNARLRELRLLAARYRARRKTGPGCPRRCATPRRCSAPTASSCSGATSTKRPPTPRSGATRACASSIASRRPTRRWSAPALGVAVELADDLQREGARAAGRRGLGAAPMQPASARSAIAAA